MNLALTIKSYSLSTYINTSDFRDYCVMHGNEMHMFSTLFIEAQEPTNPFGVTAVTKIPLTALHPPLVTLRSMPLGSTLD